MQSDELHFLHDPHEFIFTDLAVSVGVCCLDHTTDCRIVNVRAALCCRSLQFSHIDKTSIIVVEIMENLLNFATDVVIIYLNDMVFTMCFFMKVMN